MGSPARPTVVVDGREIGMEAGESVLEALERSGIDVPSGCRSGVCKKCMLRGEGDVPAEGRSTLRPQLAAQGYFLACRTKPAGRVVVLGARGPEPIATRLERAETVAADVVRLFLRPEVPFDWRPGQYLDVLHPSGISRSYSMASLPADGLVELHVRRVPDGVVSGWLHELRLGTTLSVRGPFGQCFHIADDPRRKLLLVGAGTGLAPLLGIARDALDQGHTGPIDLVHGGLDPSRLYLRDELELLAARWPSLRVHHCVLRGAGKREHEGALDEVAIRLAGPLTAARAFVCGDDAIVRLLQRTLFMAGVPSREILADPFAPAATTPGRR